MTSVDDVLRHLDQVAEQRGFPCLGHPYSYLICARLHAYSDRVRWALLVESVGYNPRAANIVNVLYTVGNCLPAATGGHTSDHLRRIENINDLAAPDNDDYVGTAPIVIRGHAITVNAPAGEQLQDVFRRLVPDHQELLMATEEELRAWLPTDLRELLRLDQWHHTDMTVRSSSPERERGREIHRKLSRHPTTPFEVGPSDTETYQQLAAVLATADPTHYQPTLAPNTHWSNWPHSGSL